MRRWILIAVVVMGIPASVACDSAKAAFDCQDVCSRYKSCFDSNYDVTACRNRCRDNADKDKTWQDKASTCSSCIDDKSCSSAVFSCGGDCVGIVP